MAIKGDRKRRRTAEEIETELAKDPEYQARQRLRQAKQTRLREELRQAESPLIEGLAVADIKVQSVWDLVNTSASYPDAIPILLEHLQRPYPEVVREGIARALAVPDARWAWEILLELFRREPEGRVHNVKFALACALAGAADDEVLDDVIELVSDQRNGESRLALIDTLVKSKVPRAHDVLERLRDDPQLAREIRAKLGRPRRH